MGRQAGYLFFGDTEDDGLDNVLRKREREMINEINAIEGNRLLNTSIEDLCDYFEQKYKYEVPRLFEEEINVSQCEEKIDVSKDPSRDIDDRSHPYYVTGTAVTYFIPFEGDAKLFRYRPNTFNLNPPRGSIVGNELILTYTTLKHDANAIKSLFQNDFNNIKWYLGQVESDVSNFNSTLRSTVRRLVEARQQKLLKDQGLVASLGFPLRKREEAPKTYLTPNVRRKAVKMPIASMSPFVPEPSLDMQEYENILNVICNMVMVMERSPRAFKDLNEEDLRQHFLVQLNGQYEGQATGETFNYEGKTDILIRAEGKNIFIAECKFWHGQESLKEAIDQLLNYTSWRDTKTALLIFNRGKEFSRVLSQIPEVVKAHSNFKRKIPYQSETGFRFILHHRDDKNRELVLTILAFEVPA